MPPQPFVFPPVAPNSANFAGYGAGVTPYINGAGIGSGYFYPYSGYGMSGGYGTYPGYGVGSSYSPYGVGYGVGSSYSPTGRGYGTSNIYTPSGPGYGWAPSPGDRPNQYGYDNNRPNPYANTGLYNPITASAAGVAANPSAPLKSFGIPWPAILGGLGGMALGVKLLGSWGAGLWDSLLSVGTVALTAVAGAVVFNKAADMLNEYGERNRRRQASSSPGNNSYMQHGQDTTERSASTAPGDIDKAVAQYRSGAPTADINSPPAGAPVTPMLARNTSGHSSKPTSSRA